MKLRNLLLFGAILVLLGCKNAPTGPGWIQDLSLGLNAEARYSWSVVEADSLSDTIVVATDTLQTRVAAVDDIVGAYTGLIRMEAYSVPHYIGTTKVWYKQYPDSLVEVAYSTAGATSVVLPKMAGRSSIGSRILTRGNGDYVRLPLLIRWILERRGIEDTTIERTDKRIVYRYPLSVGASWTSFSDPFLQTREVEDYETVTAGDQTFWCARIRTRLPLIDPDVEWFDYVSAGGLVRRVVYYPAMQVTSSDNPDGPGQIVSITESLNLIQ